MKVLPLRKHWPATLALGLLAGTAIGCSESGVTDVPGTLVETRGFAVTTPTPVQQEGQICVDGPAGTYSFTISETDPNNIGAVQVSTPFTLGAGQCVLVAKSDAIGHPYAWTVDFLVTSTGAPVNAALSSVTKTQYLFQSRTDTNPALTTTTGSGPGDSFFLGIERAALLVFTFSQQQPSLSITKTADAASVNAGSQIGFTVTLSSNGPGTATGVTLSDALPTGTGVSWSMSSSVNGCSIASNTLSCDFGDLASGQTRIIHLISATTTSSCGVYNNTASASATNHAQVQATASTTVICPPPPGGEGCTPGYWKQSQHFGNWAAPYSPNMQFSAVFEDAFPGMTLLEVLGQGGGGLKALGRHTVAALLNGASSQVNANMSAQAVIDAFNAVFPGGDYDSLHGQLAGFNEQGCPLARNP